MPRGPAADTSVSEVMSPSGSSAPPQIDQGLYPPGQTMGYPPLPPLSTQVVQSVTTIYRGRADVEAPDTPSTSATRKRLALGNSPSGRRGPPRRSRSPTPAPQERQPMIPGLPHPYPAPLPIPAGSPMAVSPGSSHTAIAVQQHSGAQLGPNAARSDATSSHQ